jgi:3-phenylpropionate/trans-cinnamate dioxygenase ferredoxin reductase subunit
MPAPVVVVGASLAGLRAAEQLRAAGWAGPLTVIGEETHPPYNRPPLSKEALVAHRDGALGAWHAAVAFRQKPSVADVEWRLGVCATGVDLAGQTLTLADGDRLDWCGLVVATGLRPRRLPLPGPRRGRAVLRSLDDARSLGRELRPGSRVVVVGAGFIGCELAATAVALGCSVTVVEPLPAPLVRAVGEAVGRAVGRYHESKGVRIRCGRSVTRVLASAADPDRVGAVELDDGSRLPADVLIEAVGSRPNTEWLAGNGLDLADGVRCDRFLRVEGRPHVVAAGDVARVPNPRFDEVPRRVEHWCTPADTARQAAATLARTLIDGAPEPAAFAPLPSFWSDQHDLRLQSFGMPAIADASEIVSGGLDRLDEGVVVHYRAEDRLVGVLLINVPPRQHRVHRALVDEACPAPPPVPAEGALA